MYKLFSVFKEQWENKNLIWQLTFYNLKSQYANHYLGVFWSILQPAMQVGIYYLVFGLGLRGVRGDVGELPFIIHLISGLFPWLFLSQAINTASNSIQSQISLVTKMKFPSSTLISIAIFNGFVNLILTTSILVIIVTISGHTSFINYWGFIYFIIASYLFAFAFGLIMSSLVIIIRDMKNVLQNVIRMFFFLTPIFWTLENVHPILAKITDFNPFAYLVMNYRHTFVLSEGPLYGDFSHHLYFWSLTLVLLYIGVHIHYRFKNKLIDYL